MIVLQKISRSDKRKPALAAKRAGLQFAAAVVIALVIVWSGYGFAIGRVRESMQVSPDSMPSFQHFPPSLQRLGRSLILSDARVPAPALLKGLATAWVLNKTHPDAYLFGHTKHGGWWYFFLVGVAVKSPIPFALLVLAGLLSLRQLDKGKLWIISAAPVTCTLGVLLVTMPVKYNAGVRHVLVVFPLLAIMGGCGCSYFWRLEGQRRLWRRTALVALLLWQCVSTISASSDYIAYFNELAGNDPSTVLVAGCDLDCGQDLLRLSHELKSRQIAHATLALWTSADMSKVDLPEFDVAQPYRPVTGWFAISLRALRFGDVFHSTYPPGAFAWLDRYQPVARVGKTILLYDIPKCGPKPTQSKCCSGTQARGL